MTMAGTPVAQNLGVIKLDDNSGSLTDYSDQITTSSITPRIQVGSFYVISTENEQQNQGNPPRGYDISLTVLKTNNAADLYNVLMTRAAGSGTAGANTARSFEGYDPDTGSGSEKWAGEVVLTAIGSPVVNKVANSGEVTTVTFTFRAHDGLVKSTVS